MNTIELEDMVTVCLDSFIESAYEIAGSDDIVIEEWYKDLTDKEKKEVSSQLIDIIKTDIDKINSEKKTKRKDG